MAEMRVKALRDFYDRSAKANRAAGEEFAIDGTELPLYNACGVEQGGEPLVEELAPERAARPEEDDGAAKAERFARKPTRGRK